MGLRDSLAASRLELQSDFKLESVELRADPMHQNSSDSGSREQGGDVRET